MFAALVPQVYKPSFEIVATPLENDTTPCYFPGCPHPAFFDWQVAHGKPVAFCIGTFFRISYVLDHAQLAHDWAFKLEKAFNWVFFPGPTHLGWYLPYQDFAVAHGKISRILETQVRAVRHWPVGMSPIEGILRNYRFLQRVCIKKFVFLNANPIFATYEWKEEKSKKI
jgi:hypothetical protein